LRYRFVSMTREYAQAIVEQWKYGGDYSIYDYVHEAEHMLDAAGWGVGVFAVLDGRGALLGELSIEFYDQAEHYTEYEDYGDDALINHREMWIGFGLRPDWVGRGLGPGFVRACAHFAVEHCHYRGEYVRLGVAAFNQRAIKAYERAGFEAYDRAVGKIAGREYDGVYMRMKLRRAHG